MIYAVQNMARQLMAPIIFQTAPYLRDLARMEIELDRSAPYKMRSPQYGNITQSPQAQRYQEHTFGYYEKTAVLGPPICIELARIQVLKKEALIIRYVDKWVSDLDLTDGPFQSAIDDITWHIRINKDPSINRFVGERLPGYPHPDAPELEGIWQADRNLGILCPENCTVQFFARLDTNCATRKKVAGRLIGYRIGQDSDEALVATRAAK